jgi:signal peptidase I
LGPRPGNNEPFSRPPDETPSQESETSPELSPLFDDPQPADQSHSTAGAAQGGEFRPFDDTAQTGTIPDTAARYHPENDAASSSGEVGPTAGPGMAGFEAPRAFEQLPAGTEAVSPSSGWQTARMVAREIIETVVLTLIIFFLIQTVIKNFRVVGTSMEPNLHDGQYLIIDKISYRLRPPERGEVIVFEPPNRPNDDYVKRIMGLPGDTLEVRNGQIFVNGEPLPENFAPRTGTYNYQPTVLGNDQVFVLGDNRNNSNDSHNWGPLDIDRIVGRAWISYWPPSAWGLIPRDAPTDEATLTNLLE